MVLALWRFQGKMDLFVRLVFFLQTIDAEGWLQVLIATIKKEESVGKDAALSVEDGKLIDAGLIE